MIKSDLFNMLGCLILTIICWTNPSAVDAQNPQGPGSSPPPQQPMADVSGVWSGTFFSNHSNVAPFTVTLVITKQGAHFVGNSSLSSDCLRGAKVQVNVSGTTVVLAGSNDEGDNMTVRGTLDSTAKMMQAAYILNGSATGSCETDDGKGQLAKH